MEAASVACQRQLAEDPPISDPQLSDDRQREEQEVELISERIGE